VSQANQLILQSWVNAAQTLEKLKVHREELLQIYTPKFPLVISANNQIAELTKKQQEIKDEIKKLPAATQKEINLKREVKIKNKMYEGLLTEMHRLDLGKAGLVGDIIALDTATPPIRVGKKKSLILLTGLLIGFWLSSLLIIIKSVFTKTIEDFNQVEEALKIPVRTIIPFSKQQQTTEKKLEQDLLSIRSGKHYPLILASEATLDPAVESLRSLYTNLRLMNPTNHQVIAIMGTLGNIGKSFVSANLAWVIASTGKKVLLIDADIR